MESYRRHCDVTSLLAQSPEQIQRRLMNLVVIHNWAGVSAPPPREQLGRGAIEYISLADIRERRPMSETTRWRSGQCPPCWRVSLAAVNSGSQYTQKPTGFRQETQGRSGASCPPAQRKKAGDSSDHVAPKRLRPFSLRTAYSVRLLIHRFLLRRRAGFRAVLVLFFVLDALQLALAFQDEHVIAGAEHLNPGFRAKLVAYNKRYRPEHVPELLLNTPARLGTWCRRMRDLCLLVVHDPRCYCPAALVEKAYRCADRVCLRLNKDRVGRSTPPGAIGDAIRDLDNVGQWCDALADIAPSGPSQLPSSSVPV